MAQLDDILLPKGHSTMPLTSVTKDPARFTLTLVGDYAVSQQRLWDAFADPRQLERFWGPPTSPATFTLYDFRVGGRAEYFMAGPAGENWGGSWKFTEVDPIDSFEAYDGDGNVDDPDMPGSMMFSFATTPTGSRLTVVTQFSSLEALEKSSPCMEEGFRAALPQLDALLG